MNWLIWPALGGLLGWLAVRELGSGMSQGMFMNVGAGASGALAAGWLLVPLAWPEVTGSGGISLGGLFAASFGAIVLLAVVNLIPLRRHP